MRGGCGNGACRRTSLNRCVGPCGAARNPAEITASASGYTAARSTTKLFVERKRRGGQRHPAMKTTPASSSPPRGQILRVSAVPQVPGSPASDFCSLGWRSRFWDLGYLEAHSRRIFAVRDSRRRHSTIDSHPRAGDKRGLVRRKISHHRRNLIRPAQASHRLARAQLRASLFLVVLVEFFEVAPRRTASAPCPDKRRSRASVFG